MFSLIFSSLWVFSLGSEALCIAYTLAYHSRSKFERMNVNFEALPSPLPGCAGSLLLPLNVYNAYVTRYFLLFSIRVD